MWAFIVLSALVAGLILFLFWQKQNQPHTGRRTVPPRSGAQEKGQLGEQMVIDQCAQYFGDEYFLLNNCTFIDSTNGSSQIDHILISPYGIFVIETKHYAGLIFGTKKDHFWTQCLPNSKKSFQNPILQNKKHINVIAQLLKGHIAPHTLHSVIIFNGNSQFKYPMPAHVLKGDQWIHYIKTFRTKIMSLDEVRKVYVYLETMALPKTQETEDFHIQNLKRKYPEKARS